MKPIFIGGCERSGTTMLGALIGGHDDCLTTPASQFLTDTARGYGEGVQANDLKEILLRIGSHRQFRNWSMSLPELRNEQTFSDLYSTLFQAYAAERKPEARFWVSHSPANIRHGPSLSRLFPDAKFVHIVRDGRAVAASLKKLPAGRGTMRELALTWSERLSHGLALEHALGQDRVLRVKYEDLLNDTNLELGKIVSFIGIDYQDKMVLGDGFRVGGQGGHALVGKAPLLSRGGAWKEELSSREIELFEFYSAELLELLGFQPCYGLSARPPDLKERIDMKLRSSSRPLYDYSRKSLKRVTSFFKR